MKPDQLAEIRQVLDALGVVPQETVRALLAEVERLRAGIDVVVGQCAAAVEDVARQAKEWRDTYQQFANATDEFLTDLLALLPGAEDEGMDAYDQIPRGIKALTADRDRFKAELATMADSVTEAEIDATEAESERDEAYAARNQAREIAAALEEEHAQLIAAITRITEDVERDAADAEAAHGRRVEKLIDRHGSWSSSDPDIARLGALVERQRRIAADLRRALTGGEDQ